MKYLSLLVLGAIQALALVTPSHAALLHSGVHRYHRRDILARLPRPDGSSSLTTATAEEEWMLVRTRKRRAGNKRCTPPNPSPLGLIKTTSKATTTAAAATNKPLGAVATSSSKTTSSHHSPPPPSQAAEPAPPPNKQAPPPPPPPPKNVGGPSYMSGMQVGQGTYYSTGLGACGITNQDTDYIAAVSHLLYDSYPGYTGGNPNKNPLCGRRIRANYQGKSVTIIVTDRCAACAITDLDFSPSAFRQLADMSIGRISGMQWEWA